MGSIRRFFPAFFLFFVIYPLFAQNAQSQPPSSGSTLAVEISRLEKLISGTAGTVQTGTSSSARYAAFLNLIQLHRLSGNSEAALKSSADALALFPEDGCFLLEQAKLLLSHGEYEKAAEVTGALLRNRLDAELVVQGRFLDAQINAFGFGNAQPLALLADDPDLAEYRAGIYYTLWKLTGLAHYRTRLTAEFPRSPEAKIAAAVPGVDSAPAPLWLLFPGRESIAVTAAASVQASIVSPSAVQPASGEGPVLLQTGFFGREENARAMGESLKKAGFEPQISLRNVNGNDRWAVTVPGGRDLNATIKLLKDAGFESFPVR